MGELIKVSEAAKRLGVSKRSLYRWIEAGRLRSCVLRLPSGRLRIDWPLLVDELKAWDEFWRDRRKKLSPDSNDNR